MQVLISVLVFFLVCSISLLTPKGGSEVVQITVALIGLIAVVVANILSGISGWKKVRQRIGNSEKPLSLQNQEIAKSIVGSTGVNSENPSLTTQHNKLLEVLEKDIKTKVDNVQSIVTKEQHIREEREKSLSPQGKDFATAVEKLADYTNLLTDLTRKHDSLQRDYDNLNNQIEFQKEQIIALSEENNELKSAMLGINTGYRDDSQGRGRSR